MRFDLQKQQLQKLWSQRNFAYVIAGIMGVSNIVLASSLSSKEEQWVLIPQFDTNDRMPVSKNSLSTVYLEKWATGILQDLLTANPDSVDLKVHRFLEVASTAFGSMEEDLRVQAKKQKEEGFSTAFYPKETTVSKKTIWVTGTFLTYFGRDKTPVSEQKTFKLGYRRAGHGVVLVTGIEGKNDV